MNIDTQQLNKDVNRWAKSNEADLKSEARSLGIEHRANSPSSSSSVEALKSKVSNRFGIVSKIGIKFPQHMVYVHKGVGKGTPIARQGMTNRKAKEWFNPVIDKNIEQLADIIADGLGESIVNRLNFK
jgi:hypothetical protein